MIETFCHFCTLAAPGSAEQPLCPKRILVLVLALPSRCYFIIYQAYYESSSIHQGKLRDPSAATVQHPGNPANGTGIAIAAPFDIEKLLLFMK